MEKNEILNFLEKLDKLLAEIRNPSLNRFEHSEIMNGMKATYEFVNQAEIPVKKEEPKKVD
jgi:hypothetical protein